MNMPLVLDSNAVISLFEGDDELERALMGASRLLIPAVAYGEILAGIESPTRRARQTAEALEGLLATPDTEVLPVTQATARYYSKIYNHLKKAGMKIPIADVWIAAATMECGGRLFTRDRHFLAIPMLDLVESAFDEI